MPPKQILLLTIVLAFAPLAVSGAAKDSKPPRVTFGPTGVTVRDLDPGTRVAWMAIIREPRDFHVATRIIRGHGPVPPASELPIALSRADETHAIWTVVDVDKGKAVHAKPEKMAMSRRKMVIEAPAGETSLRIGSTAVEVLYVRPGTGAWSFSVADGGGLDGDDAQNGAVVMRLLSLQPLKDNPEPPRTIERGDLVLVIDPKRFRTATFEVKH